MTLQLKEFANMKKQATYCLVKQPKTNRTIVYRKHPKKQNKAMLMKSHNCRAGSITIKKGAEPELTEWWTKVGWDRLIFFFDV